MSMTTIEARELCLQYGKKIIAKNLSLAVNKPEIISIIGPNGSGKSTLLKAMGRLLTPTSGTVYLNGDDIRALSREKTAQIISVLPQSVHAPGDITVHDLVTYGRLPFQSMLAKVSAEDEEIIAESIAATEMTHLQHRELSALSGGELQRAWLSMAIARRPRILLLDEPTTYLDIHHQLELMKLIEQLYATRNMTVIMVLHDLNHASRFSQRLIAVKDGRIFADGTVTEVFCRKILEPLYDIRAVVTEVAGEDEDKHLVCVPYAAL